MQSVSMSGASVFWTDPVLAWGGQYRLCWCSSGQHCSSGEQFRTDFGSFTLIGPSPAGQDRTCIAGLSCAVGSLTGQHLSALNQYVVLDTCGVASPVAGMPTGLETIGAHAVAAISVTAMAGQYRLCWCSGTLDPLQTNSSYSSLANLTPSNGTAVSYCRTAEEFRVDVGSLLLIGASTLVSDFTCIAGRDCTLDDIVGISLSDGDSIVVLDTCGEHGAALQPQARANGTQAGWQTITIPGGVYRLCWCSAAKQCNSAGEFDLDIGRLYVLGPRPLAQDRTCVSGMECAARGIDSFGELQAGSIAILSTCGVLEGRDLWARLPLSNVTSLDLVTDIVMTSAGGNFKLCWCSIWAGGCETQEGFNVDFGNLHLIGPFPLQQDRTCIAGAECPLTDIAGYWITQQSAVLVMHTCGFGRPVQPLSGPGGQYRLCWCSMQPCSARDAVVDFGQLTLAGPAPLYQHRTCVSGLSCQLASLTGTFWSGDVWVLDTCGTQQGLIAGFALDGRSAISMPEAHVDYSYPVTATGGQYRLCWCSDGVLVNQSGWSDASIRPGCHFAEDFAVDMGSLLLVGISPLVQDRTCIAGQHCQLAGLQGYGLSSLDTIVVLDTCGQKALRHWPDPATVLETSGQLSVSWSVVSAAGGQYRLCWCPGLTWTSSDEQDQALNVSGTSVQTLERRCSSAELFRVDFGSLTLVGPTPVFQHYTCTSGQICQLVGVEGVHINNGDRIQLLETCGVAARGAVPLGVPLGGLLQTSALGSNTSNSSFNFSLDAVPISGFGGTYRLCWCSSAVDCSSLEAVRVDIGQLTILGAHPPIRDYTCVSGRQCTIDGVEGIFAADFAFMVLDTCGSHASIEQGQIVQSLTGSSLSWESGVLSGPGGQYRLCWCSSLDETQILLDNDTNSSSVRRYFGCDTFQDFSLDAGEVHLVGPMLGQARTCIAGQLCRIEGLIGYGLTASDRLLVMSTCGSTVPTGFPGTGMAMVLDVVANSTGLSAANSTGLSTANSTGLSAANSSDFWNVAVTGPGGRYRLCWCSGTSCTASQRFVVDFGELMLIGPRPLQQHRTCISGRACFLTASADYDLEGLEVNSTADGLLAIPLSSTCGSQGAKRLEGVTGYMSIPGGSSPAAVAQTVPRISEPGGLYRLCWCSAEASSCMTEHHAVQVGVLTILGPAPLTQDHTCISGNSCRVHISTSPVDARVEGALMVLETCGLPLLLPRFLPDGRLPLVGADTVSNASLLSISAAGGQYRLCWCTTATLSVTNQSVVNATGQLLEACGGPSDFILDAVTSATTALLKHL